MRDEDWENSAQAYLIREYWEKKYEVLENLLKMSNEEAVKIL